MRQGNTVYRVGWLGAIGLSAAIGLGALPVRAEPGTRDEAPKEATRTSVRANDSVDVAARAEPDVPKRRWYGYQSLIPGAASHIMLVTTLFATNGGADNPAAFYGVSIGALAMHALSGPIAHLAHGHPAKALESFGLLAVPPAFSLALMFGGRCGLSEGTGGCGGLEVGAILLPIGLIAGVVIESAVLAKEDVPPRPRTRALSPASRSRPWWCRLSGGRRRAAIGRCRSGSAWSGSFDGGASSRDQMQSQVAPEGMFVQTVLAT